MYTRSIKVSRSRSRSSKSTLNQSKINKKKSISKTPQKKSISKTPQKKIPEEEKKSENPVEMSTKSNSNKKKSYLEIIKEYIDIYDGEILNPESPEKKECFTLIEDLKIIYEMAKDEQEQSNLSYFWKNLAQGTIKRGVESIRSRYKKFLKFLEKDDFDKVIEHLREKGSKGYIMKFAKSENKRKFVGIIPEKSEITMSTSNREPQPLRQAEPNSQASVDKRVKESEGKKPQSKDFQLLRHILIYEDVILGNRSTIENCWRENEKTFKIDQMVDEVQGELFIQTDFQTRKVLSNLKDNDVALLELHLSTLVKNYSLDKQKLGEIMMDVSGDLNDLKELLDDPNNIKLKWAETDDEALKNCKSIEDDSFQLLLKYKGKEKIKKRIQFLKLDLPFAGEFLNS